MTQHPSSERAAERGGREAEQARQHFVDRLERDRELSVRRLPDMLSDEGRAYCTAEIEIYDRLLAALSVHMDAAGKLLHDIITAAPDVWDELHEDSREEWREDAFAFIGGLNLTHPAVRVRDEGFAREYERLRDVFAGMAANSGNPDAVESAQRALDALVLGSAPGEAAPDLREFEEMVDAHEGAVGEYEVAMYRGVPADHRAVTTARTALLDWGRKQQSLIAALRFQNAEGREVIRTLMDERKALGQEGEDTRRLDWLEQRAVTIDFGQDEYEEPRMIHEIRGSVNDREWHRVGMGSTVREAIDRALSTLPATTPEPGTGEEGEG